MEYQKENSKINKVIENALKNLNNLVDVNTIIGKPIKTEENETIIPISKVSVGFVTGGGEYNNKQKKKKNDNYPFAGGSGGGCNITPLGFLVVKEGVVKFIRVGEESNFSKVVDFADKIASTIKKD